ncbi:MAG: flagellar biosynthesis anti-sigma factor FlgM [Gammaproteobacteria bacterium]|nr:flagellar biosynthesis anti-sigma factor FlgM [Gammaproteobacteria bacterium]
MAIEISGNVSSPSQNTTEASQVQKQQAAQTTKPTVEPTRSQEDRVTVTDTAAQLQALEKVIAKEPAVNLQKVDDVRAAVNNKQYDINPERVADKMLNFEGALNNARG